MKAQLLALVLGVICTGCGLADGMLRKQQAITLATELKVAESPLGRGRSVQVIVSAERPSPEIGRRDLHGPVLLLERRSADIIRIAVLEGLTREGFAPLIDNASDVHELRVEIQNVQYANGMQDMWTGIVRASSGVRGICVQGDVRLYEKLYEEQIVDQRKGLEGQLEPSMATINKKVSAAISHALDSMLQDQKLIECLAQ